MTTYTFQINNLEFVSDPIFRGSQSWTRETTISWSNHVLRSVIKMDWYAAQSQFYVEVFSPATLSWNRVHTLPSAETSKNLPSADCKNDDLIYVDTEMIMENMFAYAQIVLQKI